MRISDWSSDVCSSDLAADPRAALLVDGTAGLDEPLTGARASVLGRLRRDDDPGRRARYLRRHPSAEGYAGFGDFEIWPMQVDRAHLVAGFGRNRWELRRASRRDRVCPSV